MAGWNGCCPQAWKDLFSKTDACKKCDKSGAPSSLIFLRIEICLDTFVTDNFDILLFYSIFYILFDFL